MKCDCGSPITEYDRCRMCANQCDLATAANELKPQGYAWPRDPESTQAKFFAAIGDSFHHIEDLLCCLLDEKTGCKADKTLCMWEEALGIGCPPVCGGLPAYDRPETLEERQALVCALLTARGAPSCEFFEGMAAEFGWVVNCVDPEPECCAEAGLAEAGVDCIAFYEVVDVCGGVEAGKTVASEPLVEATISLCVGECCPDIEAEDELTSEDVDPCDVVIGGYQAGVTEVAEFVEPVFVQRIIECCPDWTVRWEVDLCASGSCNPTQPNCFESLGNCENEAGAMEMHLCDGECPEDCCEGASPFDDEAQEPCLPVEPCPETRIGFMEAMDDCVENCLDGQPEIGCMEAFKDDNQCLNCDEASIGRAGQLEAQEHCPPVIRCADIDAYDDLSSLGLPGDTMEASDCPTPVYWPACDPSVIPDPGQELQGMGCNIEAGITESDDLDDTRWTWRGISSWQQVERLFERFRPCHLVFEYEAV